MVMAVSNKSTARKVDGNQAKQGTRAASRQAAKKPASGKHAGGKRTAKKGIPSKAGKSEEEINEYQDHLAFKTGVAIFGRRANGIQVVGWTDSTEESG